MRNPAQPNIYSKCLEWVPASPVIAEWLGLLNIGPPDTLEVCYVNPINPVPAYARASSAKSDQPYIFIKLTPAASADQERHAARLSKYLRSRFVNTTEFIEEQVLADGTHAFIYKWVEGRKPSCSLNDMHLLGRAVASLHAVLETQSLSLNIAGRTKDRIYALLAYAHSSDFVIAATKQAEHQFIMSMRDAFFRHVDFMLKKASPCHGDLNQGNILIDRNESPLFLDLEDSLHTCVWPGFDLTKIIERVILPASEANRRVNVSKFIDALVESYSAAGGKLGSDYRPGSGEMATTMRWHMGLAVLLLIKNQQKTREWFSSEIIKFKAVEDLIQCNESLL